MCKKRNLLLILCLMLMLSFFSMTVYATETLENDVESEEYVLEDDILSNDILSGMESLENDVQENVLDKEEAEVREDIGWVRLVCTVPSGFPGTVKVVLYEVEEQKELPFFLRSDTEYSSLEPLRFGTYKIAAVAVSGGAEGCFETGFSTESFIVSSSNEEPVVVPVYLGIAEEMQGDEDNKYLGMTYEEVMAEIKGSSSNSDTVNNAEGSISTEEPVFEVETEEEYYENVKEYVEENTKNKEMAKKEKSSFIFSLGITLFLLFGTGVAFYFYKKSRDL